MPQLRVDTAATSLTGSGARVWINKDRGSWLVNAGLGALSPELEMNDLGFMNRADHINGHAGFGYNWTKPTKHVRHHNLIGAVFGSRNFDGDVTDLGLWANKFWWFKNNWVTEVGGSYSPETTDPARSRGGPLVKTAPTGSSTRSSNGGCRVRYYYCPPTRRFARRRLLVVGVSPGSTTATAQRVH